MTIAIVLALLVLTVVNFAFEWIPIEVFSLIVIVALVGTGVLTPQQAFLGFANSAIIMIAGIMILTGGIIHNGAADIIARKIRQFAGAREGRVMAFLLLAENVMSMM